MRTRRPRRGRAYLRRALEEPPAGEDRLDVLRRARGRRDSHGRPAAAGSDYLRRSLAELDDVAQRPDISLAYAQSLIMLGNQREAIELLRNTSDAVREQRSAAPLAAGGTPDHRGPIRPGALPAGRGAADRGASGRSRGTCHLRCAPRGLRLRGGSGGNVNRGSRRLCPARPGERCAPLGRRGLPHARTVHAHDRRAKRRTQLEPMRPPSRRRAGAGISRRERPSPVQRAAADAAGRVAWLRRRTSSGRTIRLSIIRRSTLHTTAVSSRMCCSSGESWTPHGIWWIVRSPTSRRVIGFTSSTRVAGSASRLVSWNRRSRLSPGWGRSPSRSGSRTLPGCRGVRRPRSRCAGSGGRTRRGSWPSTSSNSHVFGAHRGQSASRCVRLVSSKKASPRKRCFERPSKYLPTRPRGSSMPVRLIDLGGTAAPRKRPPRG